MVHKLTITVPDDAFASLQSAAASASRTPEELAAEAVVERFASPEAQPADEEHGDWRTALRDVMRSRGHLVEAAPRKARLGAASLPPRGSPERLALEEELADELGAAFERSGLSVLDLVERR